MARPAAALPIPETPPLPIPREAPPLRIPETPPKNFIRVKRAARILGCKPGTLAVNRYRELHQIPCYRLGKLLIFDPDELRAYVRARKETLARAPTKTA
jgi:hypothetical protein